MLGSARGPRAGFGGSPKQSLLLCGEAKLIRDDKAVIASTRSACAPHDQNPRRLRVACPIRLVLIVSRSVGSRECGQLDRAEASQMVAYRNFLIGTQDRPFFREKGGARDEYFVYHG